MLRDKLHRNVMKAVITTLKEYKPNDHDDKVYAELQKYFIDVLKGVEITTAFCPSQEQLIELFEMETNGKQTFRKE